MTIQDGVYPSSPQPIDNIRQHLKQDASTPSKWRVNVPYIQVREVVVSSGGLHPLPCDVQTLQHWSHFQPESQYLADWEITEGQMSHSSDNMEKIYRPNVKSTQ